MAQQEMSGLDRRHDPRVRLEVEVGLDTDSQIFTGLSGDISRGGVFVSTYRDIPIGCEVMVTFALPGGEVVARGVVRWHRQASEGSSPGVGIAFEELAEKERGIIEAFCRMRDPLYFDEGDRISNFG